MSIDAAGLTSSTGSVNAIVCADGSTMSAAGSNGKVSCQGDTDSQVRAGGLDFAISPLYLII